MFLWLHNHNFLLFLIFALLLDKIDKNTKKHQGTVIKPSYCCKPEKPQYIEGYTVSPTQGG